MMTQKEILMLALDGAISVWSDFYYLAGLDTTDACYNYKCNAPEAKLREAREQMEIWSKKADWLQAQIDTIEAEEKALRRAERQRQKSSKHAA